MQTHELKRDHANKKPARVGRGGKRGKTSGRGTKGQKARAGRKLRPEMRDIIKKLPKLRGRGVFGLKTIQKAFVSVPVSLLEKNFKEGDKVTVKVLADRGIVASQSGRMPKVKILDGGEITKKLNVKGLSASQSAKEKIEKAGGSLS
ncbi:MAG: uL15 family ribosomal protein [bacterium]|nr:uL15 family ribosomal protein [bacterium]